MGLTDVFSKEDRVEITISQFHDLMEEAVKTELILNGLEARINAENLLSIFGTERKPNIAKDDYLIQMKTETNG